MVFAFGPAGVPIKFMSPAILYLKNRLAVFDTTDRRRAIRGAVVAAIHLVAVAIMLSTEDEAVAKLAFVFTWGLLNFFWLAVLRRPAAAAALSLGFIVALILLSQLKHSVLFMTVNFVDLMIIDTDTFAFLLTVFPGLGQSVALAVAAGLVALILVWRLDPFRIRARHAALGSAVCLVGLAGVSFAIPTDPYNEFYTGQYVSKFARSGVTAVSEYFTRGLLDADAAVTGRLKLAPAGTCRSSRQLPHIVMVFDEFELRPERRARRQAPARLPASLRVVRRKAAHVDRGGRGRSQLVHRIQRADRPVGALLWALRRFRHPYRGRTGRARAAARAAALRL